MIRLRRILGAALATATVVLMLTPGAALASGPTVTGGGSTWVQIALDQWRADAAEKLGININYQGVGSTAGRQFYIIGQVDFAATEIPFVPSELAQLAGEHKSFQYIPDVAGGTSLMYNLKDAAGHRITNLQLSAGTIAKIFTGVIKNWSDPAITADNGGHHMPNEPIQPVLRSDGSGTSAKLADYLAHEAPSVWNPFARKYGIVLPLQFWPGFPGSVSQKGSDGVANFVANDSVGTGAIGYVETGYAVQRGFPVASVRNASGHYIQPTSANVSLALTHARLNKDLTENLVPVYNAGDADSYPLASYSYLITQTKGFDPAKGKVLGEFINYIVCAGQQEAAPLGYSPMPPNLVKDAFVAEQRIPGAPKPPPLSQCDNPTITGKGNTGGSPTGGNPGGTGGTTQTGGTKTGGTKTGGTGKGSNKGGGKSTVTLPGSTPTPAAGVASLPPSEVKVRFDAAMKQVGAVPTVNRSPYVIGGAALLLILFLPFMRRERRRSRGKHTGGES